jgi:hypothetical protein
MDSIDSQEPAQDSIEKVVGNSAIVKLLARMSSTRVNWDCILRLVDCSDPVLG